MSTQVSVCRGCLPKGCLPKGCLPEGCLLRGGGVFPGVGGVYLGGCLKTLPCRNCVADGKNIV